MMLACAAPCLSCEGGSAAASNSDLVVTSVDVQRALNCTLVAEVELETSIPTRVRTVVRHPTRLERQVPATELGLDHAFSVTEMRAESSYELEFIIEDEQGAVLERHAETFVTGSLPPSTPSASVSSVVEDDGALILMGPAPKDPSGLASEDEALALAVDRDGEVVWYLQNPGITTAFAPRDVRLRPDGTLAVLVPGGWNLFTLAGDVVNKYRSPREELYFHHDVIDLPTGGFATLAGNARMIDVPGLGGEVNVRGDFIIELDADGEIVWEWSTFDHLDTTRFPGPLSLNPLMLGINEVVYDWTHGNAVVYLEEEDAYLLSLRHQSWVLKIDRSSGELLWRLGPEGDFTLLDGEGEPAEWFYSQHNPSLSTDGVLTLFDNGNERPWDTEPYSRAVSYQLDEVNMTATQIWSHSIDVYSNFLGGVEHTPDQRWLVAGGGNRSLETPGKVVEVPATPGATPTWSLTYPESVIYRAHQINSLYVGNE